MPAVLLVEGPDDREVIYQFCNRHKINNRGIFEVKPQNGITELMTGLRLYLKTTSYDVVGVIVDADTDLEARWQSLRQSLAEAGYQNLPAHPAQTGTIIEAPKNGANPFLPKVGIWIMPNNQLKGAIEDFLIQLVKPDDDLIDLAKSAIAGIDESKQRFKDSYKSKALLHTWLAWQAEPGTPLGLALRRSYLNDSGPLALSFRDWLQRLYFEAIPT